MDKWVQLKRHLGNALNIGLMQDQIIQELGHVTLYAGLPIAHRCAIDILNGIFTSE